MGLPPPLSPRGGSSAASRVTRGAAHATKAVWKAEVTVHKGHIPSESASLSFLATAATIREAALGLSVEEEDEE